MTSSSSNDSKGTEADSFDVAFARQYNQFRRTAQSLVAAARGRSITGTDLVHESLPRVLRNGPYTDESALSAAVYMAMKQVILDRWRAKHRLKRGAGLAGQPLLIDPPSPQSIDSIDHLALLSALERLRHAHPDVGTVIDLETIGRSRSAIAEALGISVAVVRRHSMVGRELLKQLLKDRYDDL